MVQAWASFISDVAKHAGTAHIALDELTGLTMLFQTQRGDGAERFHEFISGWSPREGVSER